MKIIINDLKNLILYCYIVRIYKSTLFGYKYYLINEQKEVIKSYYFRRFSVKY